MIRSQSVAVVCLLLSVAALARAATIGPLTPQPVVAVYIVADGQPCSLKLTVTSRGRQEMPRFLLRVFDPDERAIHWHYAECHSPDTLPAVEPHEGVEVLVRGETPPSGEVLHEAEVRLDQPGVYQVRCSNRWYEVALGLELERDLPYGISCQNGDFLPWPGQPAEAFMWVPPHAEQLQLRGGPYLVSDQTGATVADLSADNKGSADLKFSRTGVAWRVRFPDPAAWIMRAAGMPVILCDSEQAARAIHASVEELPDGTVVCHKFQVRIAALMPQILAPEKVGRADDLTQSFADRREAWLTDPLRNAILTRAFPSVIAKYLTSQNLDPASPWGGSLDGWQDKIGAPPPENRWDRFHEIEGLRAGASSDYGSAAESLALAATFQDPTNPYFGRTELLYRAAAAALRDLMVLQEDETWPGIADLEPYPGSMAFPAAQKTFPVFGVAGPHLPEEVRAVWAEGLRRIMDRSYPDALTSARNQSSHYLVAYQAFADGSGEPVTALAE